MSNGERQALVMNLVGSMAWKALRWAITVLLSTQIKNAISAAISAIADSDMEGKEKHEAVVDAAQLIVSQSKEIAARAPRELLDIAVKSAYLEWLGASDERG